jgi:hypothetical protein
LNIDGRDLGKFRSSGIIISTGTGSTGWLYAAKQISAHRVSHLKRMIGMKLVNDDSPDLVDYEIAQTVSNKTIFPSDSNKMYYYVREGFQETTISEGFCKDMVLTSEMLGGVLKIDGHTALTIGMGDRYHL